MYERRRNKLSATCQHQLCQLSLFLRNYGSVAAHGRGGLFCLYRVRHLPAFFDDKNSPLDSFFHFFSGESFFYEIYRHRIREFIFAAMFAHV